MANFEHIPAIVKNVRRDGILILADNSRGIYIPKHVAELFHVELDINDESYFDEFDDFESELNDQLFEHDLYARYTDNGDYAIVPFGSDF